ncbi:hypothetical protein F4860DRAFT_528911 [Xylaria cubensis]|nr:hypothetical protein F4860DRAFT_528911 [Xylaria cubensis]
MYSDVPSTNPEDTTQLWSEVMSQTASKRQPRAKTQQPSTTESDDGEYLTPSGVTNEENTASPYDSDFDEQVLPAYGMSYLNSKSQDTCLLELYDLQELDQLLESNDEELDEQQRSLKTKFESLTQLSCLKDQYDCERICRGYQHMIRIKELEPAFTTFALRGIFIGEDVQELDPTDERLVPVLLQTCVCKPGPNRLWKIPQLIGSKPKKPYLWDIRPDCLFAFSPQAFGRFNSKSIEMHVTVLRDVACCAYLSIIFKKSEICTAKTARNQLIVASTIALYNRFLLKCKAREVMKWSVGDYRQLRHYGIAIDAASWTLFCTVPKTEEWDKLWYAEPKLCNNDKLPALSWKGTEMREIASGSCRHLSDTISLLSHLMSVHLWGLYTHAESCRKDIRELSYPNMALLNKFKGLKLKKGNKDGD